MSLFTCTCIYFVIFIYKTLRQVLINNRRGQKGFTFPNEVLFLVTKKICMFNNITSVEHNVISIFTICHIAIPLYYQIVRIKNMLKK